MDLPNFRRDIERLSELAEKVLEQLRPITMVASEPVNQEATPEVHYHPVGIMFDDDSQFQCFMQTAERERLHKDYFGFNQPDQPYAFKFGIDPEEPVRWLALRISDIHHLY